MYYVKVSLVCLFCVVAFVSADNKLVKLPQELLKKGLAVEQKCAEDAGAPSNSLRRLITDDWEDSSAEYVKKFIYCFLRGIKYGDDDGHFVIPKVVSLVPVGDREEFEKKLMQCNAFSGKDPMETIQGVCDCFFKTQPIRFTVE